MAAADAAVLASPRNFNGRQISVHRGMELVETGTQQRIFQRESMCVITLHDGMIVLSATACS